MSFIVALVVASSFVHDGVRSQLVAGLRRFESKSNTSDGRNNRYLLFGLRPLPVSSHSLNNLSRPRVLLDYIGDVDLRRSISAASRAVGLEPAIWLELYSRLANTALITYLMLPQTITTNAAYQISDYSDDQILPSSDRLPFPPASQTRRIAAWLIDSAILFAASSMLRGTGPIRTIFAAAAWLTRDFWLSAWGFQSPGRWAVGQVAVSTDIAREINIICCPPGISNNNSSSSSSSASSRSSVVKLSNIQHDGDRYTMLCFNSLRLFTSAFGPIGVIALILNTLPALRHGGDGRTLWDRFIRVQVIDEEDLVKWAYGTNQNISISKTTTNESLNVQKDEKNNTNNEKSLPSPLLLIQQQK